MNKPLQITLHVIATYARRQLENHVEWMERNHEDASELRKIDRLDDWEVLGLASEMLRPVESHTPPAHAYQVGDLVKNDEGIHRVTKLGEWGKYDLEPLADSDHVITGADARFLEPVTRGDLYAEGFDDFEIDQFLDAQK